MQAVSNILGSIAIRVRGVAAHLATERLLMRSVRSAYVTSTHGTAEKNTRALPWLLARLASVRSIQSVWGFVLVAKPVSRHFVRVL